MPLRTYSTGMRVRLAMGVVTSIDPEILLLDEGIGAVDAEFMKKARTRLQDLVARSGILVFASHSNEFLAQLCKTAMWVDHGTIKMTGGSEEVVGGNYYGQVDGDKAVYLFSGEDMVYFLCRKEAYITLQVTPKLAVSSPLSAIMDVTFSGSVIEKPITIEAVADSNPKAELAAMSFGPATPIVRMQGTYELDQTYGIEILGSLFDIEALDVIGYNLTDGDLAKLGFGDPDMVVDFGMKNGTDTVSDYELSLVNVNDETCLINVSGTRVVYLIEKPTFVDLDYTKLMLRWFLSPLRLDLASLVVSFGGETYTYQSGKNDDGTQYAFVNGKAMDIDLFYSFYRLVTSAASDGLYLADAVATGNPLMTITYTYLDPDKSPDVMTLYEGGTRRVDVDVNGTIEFDMKASFVDVMELACRHTVTGEPIEENW
jgi:energy-coupling factor transporter ATP-binding protein EcfA2